MERKAKARDRPAKTEPSESQGHWAFLPDLALEQIFQLLPYEVSEISLFFN